MDDLEQRQHYKDEFAKLDALRMDHAALKATVEHLNADMRDHKNFVANAIAEINDKIEKLNDRFEVVAKEVTVIATKVGLFAVAVGLVANIILKQFGFV